MIFTQLAASADLVEYTPVTSNVQESTVVADSTVATTSPKYTKTTVPSDTKTTVTTLPSAEVQTAAAVTLAVAAATASYSPVSFQSIKPQAQVKPDGYYETGLFTGAATYSYDIPVASGTAGLTPKLSLTYNS